MSADYRRRRLTLVHVPGARSARRRVSSCCSRSIAVGTGGVIGHGLMGGVQKLFYLPEPHTDFIYAVIGGELGLIGATLYAARVRA